MEALTNLDDLAQELDAFLKPESDGGQARRRERILQAAMKLFVAHGYRKTSVEDIASAAGVAKGTVYLYYRNKAELLLHAIGLEKREYLSEMAPVFDSSRSPIDRLRTMIRLSLELSVRMPLMHQSISENHDIEHALSELDDITIARMSETQLHFIAQLLDAATNHMWSREMLEGRAELLVDLIFAVASGGRLTRKEMSLAAYAAMLADVIVDGVLAATSNPQRGRVS